MRPEMRYKAAQVGIPKIRKNKKDLSRFRSITDTTNTPHYGVRRFLTCLMTSLTQNLHSIKNLFK